MPPHMVCLMPLLGANGTVRRARVSLPLVPCLVDRQRYFLPGDLPPPAGDELRALYRPRLTAHRAQPVDASP
jgi:hypothetical protein